MMSSWLLAARIKTLPAAISPVILGTALSFHDGFFNIVIFLMTIFAAILIQIGTNFANDLFDFQKGADREDRLGPPRVIQLGLISTEKMKIAIIFIFSCSVIVGTYLVSLGGWPILLIGILSIVSGIAYTAGPYPLAYHGLGDIFVFIFFGIIAVSGTYYLQVGSITFLSIIMGTIIGMLSTAILVVNNLRDIVSDQISGKKTLAVIFGKNFSRIEYSLLVLIPFILLIFIYFYIINKMSILLVCFLIPIPISLIKKVYISNGKDLNKVLNQTARLLFTLSLGLSIGLII